MVKFDEVKLAQLCYDLNLSLVVLFGSQATGKTRVGSDHRRQAKASERRLSRF